MQAIKLVLSKLSDLMLQAELTVASIRYEHMFPLLSPLLLPAFFNHDLKAICMDRCCYIYEWVYDNEQQKPQSAVANSVQIQGVQIHNILIIVF